MFAPFLNRMVRRVHRGNAHRSTGTRAPWPVAVVVAALLLLPGASGWANPAPQLRTLVESGKPGEAYELGKQNPDALGDPDFDFYFGIAAIDSGHASEGVLALERYLLAFPANPQARLELARGYFVIGEDGRAREEFTNVLALNPPPSVVANIERYIDAIRLRESRYQTVSRTYVETGFGWDTNVNGGVSAGSINLPTLAAGFNTVTIGQNGQRQGDWGRFFAAGAQVTHPVAPGVTVFGSLDWDKKELRNGGTFDTESLSGSAGATWLNGNNVFRAGAALSSFWFGHSRYRDAASVTGEWQRQISAVDTLIAGLQFAELRYMGVNEPRDTNLSALSLTYRRTFMTPWQPVLSLGLTVADDDSTRGRPEFGRHLVGGRLGLTATPAAKWGISLGLTYQESDYQGEQSLGALGVLPRRLDRYRGVDAGVTYLVNRALSVRAEGVIAENGSNINLFAYRRSAVSLKIRYEFK